MKLTLLTPCLLAALIVAGSARGVTSSASAQDRGKTPPPGISVNDANWKPFSLYLHRVTNTVRKEWERLTMRCPTFPETGTGVTVTFVLSRKGEITRVISVAGDAGDIAERICVSAITTPAPYDEWTEDMVKVLGTEQEMTFRFYYQ